jgi:hypothetical protein
MRSGGKLVEAVILGQREGRKELDRLKALIESEQPGDLKPEETDGISS